MARQLILPVALNDEATFANFFSGPNSEVLNFLQQQANTAQEKFVLLWGEAGTGRTHLLQACCHHYTLKQKRVLYLPCRELVHWPISSLDNLEHLDFIALDDVDAIAGHREYEEAFFYLYNKSLTTSCCWLMASLCPPRQFQFTLKDLQSRLAASLVFHLKKLSDEEKLAALQLRAKQRGMQLSEEVGAYLIKHLPRDIRSLFLVLEQLDKASLALQRKLTIPFIKRVLLLEEKT